MAWLLISLAVAFFVIPRLFTGNPKPIKGVYRLKGRWSFFKYWVFYVIFKLREYQNKRKSTVSGENAGYGMRSRSNIQEMEKPQELPKHPQVQNKFLSKKNHDNFYQNVYFIFITFQKCRHLFRSYARNKRLSFKKNAYIKT